MDNKNKKVGKWMPHWVDGGFFDNQNVYGYYCSECGYWYEHDDYPKICPKCSAELKEPF